MYILSKKVERNLNDSAHNEPIHKLKFYQFTSLLQSNQKIVRDELARNEITLDTRDHDY